MNLLPQLIQFAQNNLDPSKVNIPGAKSVEQQTGQIATVRGIVFGAIAAAAVLLITIAGVQYILSQGDPQKVAKAKNTILYSVIGLVITLVAATLVMFLVTELTA